MDYIINTYSEFNDCLGATDFVVRADVICKCRICFMKHSFLEIVFFNKFKLLMVLMNNFYCNSQFNFRIPEFKQIKFLNLRTCI